MKSPWPRRRSGKRRRIGGADCSRRRVQCGLTQDFDIPANRRGPSPGRLWGKDRRQCPDCRARSPSSQAAPAVSDWQRCGGLSRRSPRSTSPADGRSELDKVVTQIRRDVAAVQGGQLRRPPCKHRIGQDRANKIVIMTGAGGNFIGDVEWPSFGDVADRGSGAELTTKAPRL
jgi:hypothetical protein